MQQARYTACKRKQHKTSRHTHNGHKKIEKYGEKVKGYSTDLKRKSGTSTWKLDGGVECWETLVKRSRTCKNLVMRDDNVRRNKLQKLFFQHDSKEVS